MSFFFILIFILFIFNTFLRNNNFFASALDDLKEPESKAYNRPKDFETSLLILSSVIIKSDGIINPIELNFVRSHFLRTYGKEKANQSFRRFKNVIKQRISTRQICTEISRFMPYQARVQLVKFLFDVAYSDNQVTQPEELEIRKIASYLLLGQVDYLNIRNAYFRGDSQKKQQYSSTYSQNSDYEYEVLGLTENATDSEIKKAYRSLVKKYHPDRLQDNSKEAILVAKEKFQKIQSAYEKIKDKRGI